MPIYLGSDPDSQRPTIAGVNEHGKLVLVWTAAHTSDRRGRAAVLDSFDLIREMLDDPASTLGNLRILQTQDGTVPGVPACPDEWRIAGCAVEGQEVYKKGSGKTKNAQSIVILAGAAGAVLGCLSMAFPRARMLYPSPQEWKGSVPKGIHHKQLYGNLGWTYKSKGGRTDGYCVPVTMDVKPIGVEMVKPASVWAHLNDSIALAMWCREKCQDKDRREAWAAKRGGKAPGTEPSNEERDE